MPQAVEPETAKATATPEAKLYDSVAAVIAKRPEWRFLEQQRHLKDVLRLLIREVAQNIDLNWDPATQEEALNLGWLGLLISQERQHPPQLTRDIFLQLLTGSDNHEAPRIWANQSVQALETQAIAIRLAKQLYRLQTTLPQDQPWYLIRYFLPLIADTTPQSWLNNMNELMLLLENHDSLLYQQKEAAFKKSDLHASHPLRRQAIEAVKTKQIKYQARATSLLANQNALQEACHQLSADTASQLLQQINAMTAAWHSLGLTQPTDELERQTLYFEEAQVQRLRIAQRNKTALDELGKSDNQALKQCLSDLFEVDNA